MNQAEVLLTSTFKEDIVAALHTSPLVYVQSFDFMLVEQALHLMISQSLHNPMGFGAEDVTVCDFYLKKLVKLYTHEPLRSQDNPIDLEIMMRKILNAEQGPYRDKKIFIFNNVHQLWEDSVFLYYLHRIVDRYERGEYSGIMSILLIDDQPFSKVPSEIEKFIKVVDIPNPKLKDIEILLQDMSVSTKDMPKEKSIKEDLARTFLGLNYYEINSIIRTIIHQNGSINKRSIAQALEGKKAIVKKSGLIEVCDTEVALSDIGGLDNLVDDIRKKAILFKHLRLIKDNRVNMPYPKGVLIIGMPGCGKSLIAKAISNEFRTSLIRLDVNKLMGKYVGESEENLRNALRLAETAQPCVLWIDEIEKAFAGANGKGNSDMLIQRLMGQFLTWMQERKSAVYVVATANDVMKPEFMRKGRFDEVYFVDFPSQSDTQIILEKKLERYESSNSIFDLVKVRTTAKELAERMCSSQEEEGRYHFNKSFSGSEIESLVNTVIEEAFVKYLEEKEKGVNHSETYKIPIEPQLFEKYIDSMSESIMAKQKTPSDKEEKTAIQRIREMQSVYHFKCASS